MDEQTRRSLAEEANQESQRNNQFVGASMTALLILVILGFSYASYAGWL